MYMQHSTLTHSWPCRPRPDLHPPPGGEGAARAAAIPRPCSRGGRRGRSTPMAVHRAVVPARLAVARRLGPPRRAARVAVARAVVAFQLGRAGGRSPGRRRERVVDVGRRLVFVCLPQGGRGALVIVHRLGVPRAVGVLMVGPPLVAAAGVAGVNETRLDLGRGGGVVLVRLEVAQPVPGRADHGEERGEGTWKGGGKQKGKAGGGRGWNGTGRGGRWSQGTQHQGLVRRGAIERPGACARGRSRRGGSGLRQKVGVRQMEGWSGEEPACGWNRCAGRPSYTACWTDEAPSMPAWGTLSKHPAPTSTSAHLLTRLGAVGCGRCQHDGRYIRDATPRRRENGY